MKTISPALLSLLNSATEFLMTDLLTVTLAGGGVLRLTSADINITSGGNIFYTGGNGYPLFTRGMTRTVIGVEVDTLDLEFFADASTLISGQPFLQAVRAGAFDSARIRLDRAFMQTWGDTSAGTVNLFTGRAADVQAGRMNAKFRVNSDLELLNIKMPRNLYQPPCVHTVYDSGCAANKAAFGVSGVVAAGSGVSLVNSGVSNGPGYFDLGQITFTSGVLNGATRTVKSFSSGAFTPINPLPSAPAIGDTFIAYPGCDNQQSTCSGKFNNLGNFKGFPYIPVPETVR